MRISLKKQRGFTLIEAVVVIILMSIIAVVASVGMSQGFNSFFASQHVTDADWQGRYALERMSREIHVVRSPSDIKTASANQFSFNDINGNPISYTLSGTSLMRNTQILADGIQSVAFSYFDINGAATTTLTNIRYITINLNVTLNNSNFTLSTTENTRNLS